jgi:hypothetical protein
MSALNSSSAGLVEVKLDGLPVEIPTERRSVSAICSYLESLALQHQRVLCSLNVDGESVSLTQPKNIFHPFSRVEAVTMTLHDVPLQLIKAALHQNDTLRTRVQSASELVLINDGERAKEIWWALSVSLKEPLLTLSLIPENICGPANGRASLMQLRKWQLQQLGSVILDVDNACHCEDTAMLSDALEKRVLPWLETLHDSLGLWHEILLTESHALSQKAA